MIHKVHVRERHIQVIRDVSHRCFCGGLEFFQKHHHGQNFGMTYQEDHLMTVRVCWNKGRLFYSIKRVHFSSIAPPQCHIRECYFWCWRRHFSTSWSDIPRSYELGRLFWLKLTTRTLDWGSSSFSKRSTWSRTPSKLPLSSLCHCTNLELRFRRPPWLLST